jgi:NMD protein affecting ribosome stability and mRNA decay
MATKKVGQTTGKGKGLIRSANRSATASKKSPPAERATGRPSEPTVCEGCGAVFAARTWRRPRVVSHAMLARAVWKQCPACRQASRGEYWGRVVLRGTFVGANETEIRRRIQAVAAQAESRQPERRLVGLDRADDGLEVLTTSQKLAHRIVHELKKTFRGAARYQWSDDGSLFAVWERNVS